jgi:flagellar basal body rod protein FlgG
MNVGMYQGASGMVVNLNQQAQIAANLARQGVTGHKQAVSTFQVDKERLPSDADGSAKAAYKVGAFNVPLKLTSRLDFQQGPITASDNPLHVAIEGNSFFSVKTPEGTTAYTRNGAFRRAGDGTVVTSDGLPVLLEGGETWKINETQNVVVGGDGTIRVDGADSGRLALVNFANPGDVLAESGPSRFIVNDPKALREGMAAGDKISQGALEQSNMQPVSQMVALINVVRSYEANQRAVIANDEATSRLISAVQRST